MSKFSELPNKDDIKRGIDAKLKPSKKPFTTNINKRI